MLVAVLAAACHHAAPIDNAVPPAEGVSIAVYDRGDGTATSVIDDRRWVVLRDRGLVLDDIDPAALLPSLAIEAIGEPVRIGACHRDLFTTAPLVIGDADLQPAPTRTPAPIVTCAADGAPGRHLVRVVYVTTGLAYRAQHELRMASPDRATLRSTYTLETPPWHRTGEVAIYDGAPGGDRVPRKLASGQMALDGSVGAIAIPAREVKARLRRVFDGATPVAADVASSDVAWGEGSSEAVVVWLELADARVPPGPVHAILDLPDELARVADIPIEARRRASEGPDAPSRLAIYADEDLRGQRQRWHDVADRAELADRFVLAVTNTGDTPREVWIEEHLRTAKRRVVAHAWPVKPGLHGDVLREKLVVQPGKTERVGYTVDYDF